MSRADGIAAGGGGITLAMEWLACRWLSLELFRLCVRIVVWWDAFVLASPLAAALCHGFYRRFHRRRHIASWRRIINRRLLISVSPRSRIENRSGLRSQSWNRPLKVACISWAANSGEVSIRS